MFETTTAKKDCDAFHADPAVQALESKDGNFKTWFGASQVVDAEGNPKVVYHGTRSSFSTFNLASATNDGIFFADTAKHAGHYAKTSAGNTVKGSNIMPVYLCLENPLTIDYQGHEIRMGCSMPSSKPKPKVEMALWPRTPTTDTVWLRSTWFSILHKSKAPSATQALTTDWTATSPTNVRGPQRLWPGCKECR